jgi:hypothetical protein
MDDIERAGLLEKLSTVQQNQVSSHSLWTNRSVLLHIRLRTWHTTIYSITRREHIDIFRLYIYNKPTNQCLHAIKYYPTFFFAFDLSFKNPVLFILS